MTGNVQAPRSQTPPPVTQDADGLAARDAAAVLPTYGTRPVTFVSGDGTLLRDDAGRTYLDFLGGLAVTALGHAHPAVADALAAQARTLVHVSNLYYTEPAVRLAERLKALLGWPDGKAFLCNSGTEANEAAIKIARRHGTAQDAGKYRVVALDGGFHGRTLGALAITGNAAKREPFQPFGDWVTHVPRDDAAALDAAVDERTCAVHLEVVQGEGGVRRVPDDVLAAARAACDRVGALLVVDEVQTGLGRLGRWFGFQGTPAVPDVVCLAKSLGNGVPIGATVARGAAAAALTAGDHGSTFGGNPLAAAAALAVLDTIAADGLVEQAAATGRQLAARLDELAASHPLAAGRRGEGLLQALILARPLAADVVAAALARGLVVNNVAPDALRLAPPLTVSADELDTAVERLAAALDDVEAAT